MAQQNLNTGSSANDGTGDSLRAAMLKIQSNFTELYGDETSAEVNSVTGGTGLSVDQSTGTVTVSLDTHTGDVTGTTALTIASDAVTYDKMQDLGTANRLLGGTATGTIGEVQVATAMIAADAVDGTKIADDSINSEHYVDGSIDNAHIADDAIDSEHYADGSIDTAHIGNLQVTTAKIAADAITGAKIADDSIDSEHYVDGSIDTAHIADDAVDADKLANSINTEIAANTAKVTNATHTGEVTGSTALTIASNVVDADNLNVSGNGTAGQYLASDGDGSFTWTTGVTGDITSVVAGDGLTGGGTGGDVTLAVGVDDATVEINSDALRVKADGIDANELNVSGNGSSGQVLTSDGDGSFSWTAKTTNTDTTYTAGDGLALSSTDFSVNVDDATIETDSDTLRVKANGIDANELNVSGNGSNGQALLSDGDGTFSWGSAGNTYTAGDGLTLNTLDFDLDADLTTVTSIYNTALKVGRDSGGDWIDFGTDNQIDFYVNNANDMRLESDGDLHVEGDVIAASTTIASDEKLKENIEEYADALDKVKQLKGVSFDWKKDGKQSGGVIAQDVQKVLPELVENVKDLNGDDSHLAVNYNGLIGLLLQSIKELSDKLDNCNNCKK